MASKGRNYQVSALPVTVFANLLVVVVTALVLVWLQQYRAGLAFRSPLKYKSGACTSNGSWIYGFLWRRVLREKGKHLFQEFNESNFHLEPAITAYKTVPAKRRVRKAFHHVLHLIALLAGIVGVYAAFKYKHDRTGRYDYLALLARHVHYLLIWFTASNGRPQGCSFSYCLTILED